MRFFVLLSLYRSQSTLMAVWAQVTLASHETRVLDDQSTGESEGSLQVGLQKECFSLCMDPRIGGQEFLPMENWIPTLLVLLLFTMHCKLQKNSIMEAMFSSSSGVDHMMWCHILLTQVQDSGFSLPLFACSSALPRSESESCLCLWAWQLVFPVLHPGP